MFPLLLKFLAIIALHKDKLKHIIQLTEGISLEYIHVSTETSVALGHGLSPTAVLTPSTAAELLLRSASAIP